MSTLYRIFRLPQVVRVNESGLPYPGAKLNFYLTGTTTRADTYTDSALTTPHDNPVVADSAGQFDVVYLDPDVNYRVVVTDTNDTLIDDLDPVNSAEVERTKAQIDELLSPETADETAVGVTPIQFGYKLENGIVPVFRYMTDSQIADVLSNSGSVDVTAAIQNAINVAGVNGGRVIGPDGTYLLSTATTAGGVTYHLYINQDNVSYEVEGWHKTDTASAAILHINGGGKVDGMANWADYQARQSDDTTIYTLTGPYAAGVTSMTFATASDASNFEAGDLIIIRSGQTVAGTSQPDGEVNELLSADSGTGVVLLRHPTAKAYAAENYNTGSSGISSVGGGGTAAPYGIGVITDRMLKNIRVKGVGFDSTAVRHAIIGGQIDGFRIEGCRAKITGAGLQSMGCFRDARIEGNTVHIRGTGTTTWWLGVDSCCTDTVITHNLLTAERTGYLHVHEGANRTTVVENTILNTASASDENAISIRSRAYDTIVARNTVFNAGTQAAIYVDSYCVAGGLITDNIVRASSASAISVAAPNWTVRHHPDFGAVSLFAVAHEPVESISAWVYDDVTNPRLGTLPAYCEIISCTVHVTEAFDSDGSDGITVGYDASADAIAGTVDVSTTGLKTVTPGSLVGYNHTARDIEAYYTAGGSAPTTGKALVTVRFMRTNRRV